MKHFNLVLFFVLFFVLTACNRTATPEIAQASENKIRDVWTKEKSNEWYKKWGWLRGSDFIPSTAINQLEMWQAETFDTATINRELAWAESIGMNSMRVYLHHLAWELDPEGFKNRVAQYLDIAGRHHVST